MKTNLPLYKVTASVDYTVYKEYTECESYEIELDGEIENESDLIDILTEKFKDEFTNDNYHSVEEIIDVYGLTYERLEPISPMKVMEYEGCKPLFDLSQLSERK